MTRLPKIARALCLLFLCGCSGPANEKPILSHKAAPPDQHGLALDTHRMSAHLALAGPTVWLGGNFGPERPSAEESGSGLIASEKPLPQKAVEESPSSAEGLTRHQILVDEDLR